MYLSADMSETLNRILDAATDNLRIAKILIQMGLDPDNVTWDAIFNRLLEIFLHNITLANMFALVGAIFFVATLLTQTMVPLRVANMIGCAFFAIFGLLTGAITTFLLYLLMVPINAWRLRQMLALIKKARSATQGDKSMEWLRPFMTQRNYRKGDVLMKKGDPAHEMLLTVTGIPGRRNQRRASAGTADGRTRFPHTRQPPHRDHRMHRGRSRTDHHL